ncbi:hypothetical protein NQ318_010228 [Aromia moschata]|uniref:THAP-type domain-containing protein n=1 Tax=Aromia moschata TaxID=1265417 RepID=A0AAV8X761_9CUCU|nr:hypothetical protein NQ318_010228 [Aromia moschata]
MLWPNDITPNRECEMRLAVVITSTAELENNGARNGEGDQFPKDYDSARIWIEACNRQDLLPKILEVHKNYRLCELHFRDKHISKGNVKKTLLPDAVSTEFSHLTRTREELEENPIE